jgi:uncharacterized protein YndB with AHSA1/START domain
VRVKAETEILAPPEVVWDILADLQSRADFMADLETWEHLSGPEVGEGGRFRLRQRIGPVALISFVEIVDWKPPTNFGWTSLKGLRTWGRMTIKPTERGSKVSLRLGYASGENLLSFITDRVASPLVSRQAGTMLRKLTERVVDHLSGSIGPAARAATVTDRDGPSAKPKPAKKTTTSSKKSSARTPGTRSGKPRREKGLPRESRTPVRRTKPA